MRKILAQDTPAAATPATLYTVPVQSAATIKTMFACNRGGAAATVRIAAVPSGQSLANKHYLYYDLNIQPGDSYPDNSELYLNEGDTIQIYASTADVSFSLFGDEYKN